MDNGGQSQLSLMGSGPISNMTINHLIIIILHPIKSEMGPDPINCQNKWFKSFGYKYIDIKD